MQASIATWYLLSRLVQTLKPMDYCQKMELDKSYRILKGIICVDAQSWMLMRTIYDFVLEASRKGLLKALPP